MELKIKKLRPDAQVPIYGTKFAAGLDLFACEKTIIPPLWEEESAFHLVKTGIAIEIPEGYFGLVENRSGIVRDYGIVRGSGVIDSDYRGEIMVSFVNLSEEDVEIAAKQRIAQLLIMPVLHFEKIIASEELSETKRGEAGFGSTG